MKLVRAPRSEPPFPVQAFVEEEDTYLALSAESVLRENAEHPIRVMTGARNAEAVEPGRVVVRWGRPMKLLAVVHKLDEEPSWREEWIVAALRAIVLEATRRGVASIALPLLGTVHGRFPPARSSALTLEALAEIPRLERAWLVGPGAGEATGST